MVAFHIQFTGEQGGIIKFLVSTPYGRGTFGVSKMHYFQHQPAPGKSVLQLAWKPKQQKNQIMNDFHRTLLRSPQIPLTYFFTFPYIICCHGNTASTKLPIKII